MTSEYPKAYACIDQDREVRRRSSSGGVFFRLAEAVIRDGGTVFAAETAADGRVVHGSFASMEETEPFLGSKYVQSDMGGCFRQAKERLEEGKPVLFVGTPCQMAGLAAYLNKPYDNLLTADFICHGVPSPKVWQAYLGEAGGGKAVRRVSFRDKRTGWERYSLAIEWEDGSTQCGDIEEDPYLLGFRSNLFLRPSCHRCRFKEFSHCTDLTLGDFWMVQKLYPALYDNQGTSLVLVHSEKGARVLRRISEGMTVQETSAESAAAYNTMLTESAPPHPHRDRFFAQYPANGFSATVKKLTKPSLKRRARLKLKKLLGQEK